jgi:hypothetical protein
VTADPKTIPPFAASDSNPASEASPAAGLREDQSDEGLAPASAPGRWPIWIQRLRALLFVTLCATFGVLLVILPWTPRWTDNPLLLSSSALRDFVSSGFVRGFASGLGLLNLWLGFREAILYHEHPHGGDN